MPGRALREEIGKPTRFSRQIEPPRWTVARRGATGSAVAKAAAMRRSIPRRACGSQCDAELAVSASRTRSLPAPVQNARAIESCRLCRRGACSVGGMAAGTGRGQSFASAFASCFAGSRALSRASAPARSRAWRLTSASGSPSDPPSDRLFDPPFPPPPELSFDSPLASRRTLSSRGPDAPSARGLARLRVSTSQRNGASA